MSNAISGLVTQKPDSPEPKVGDIRRFSIEVRQKASGDGTWNKLKNEKDGYGSEYKVVKADRKDDWVSEQHGTFHQYSLLIEPQNSSGGTYSSGGEVSGGDRQNSIEAQAAAKSAARYLQGREASPEEINIATVAFFTAIQNAKEMGEPEKPSADPKAEAKPSGSPTNAADPADEIPFAPSLI